MSSEFNMSEIFNVAKKNRTRRTDKGKSLLVYIDSYTAIDLETTGLAHEENEIIELSALKVRSGNIISEFTSLIRPSVPIPSFISSLTGITNKMVMSAPVITDVLSDFLNYVGDDIILGHNVNFDVNFIYDISQKFLGRSFTNDMIDTLRLSRYLLPHMEHHNLSLVANELGITVDTVHRSSADTETTIKVYEELKKRFPNFASTTGQNMKEKKTISNNISNVPIGFEYVIIGNLRKANKETVKNFIKGIGGTYAPSPTEKTEFVILSDSEYGSKENIELKKAMHFIASGSGLKIISENDFYKIVSKYKNKDIGFGINLT